MAVSPQAIELALELVNSVTGPGQPRARSADTVLESVCVDHLARVQIALEIEQRHSCVITDTEVGSWYDVRDLAQTLARELGL